MQAVVSSQIGSDDEKEIIDGLLEWKIARIKKETTKDKIREVLQLVNEQCWNIDDLKEMSHVDSSIYRTSVQKGIPEGMARGFKADLKLFKPEWRKERPVLNVRNMHYNN